MNFIGIQNPGLELFFFWVVGRGGIWERVGVDGCVE